MHIHYNNNSCSSNSSSSCSCNSSKNNIVRKVARVRVVVVVVSVVETCNSPAISCLSVKWCSSRYNPCGRVDNKCVLHCVPKLAAPLLQTCLIQFVVHGFQRNIIHCTILTSLTVTPIISYILYRVCSV